MSEKLPTGTYVVRKTIDIREIGIRKYESLADAVKREADSRNIIFFPPGTYKNGQFNPPQDK